MNIIEPILLCNFRCIIINIFYINLFITHVTFKSNITFLLYITFYCLGLNDFISYITFISYIYAREREREKIILIKNNSNKK